ncbi:MAG: type II toxin-antitoxin system VapC family toxin [Hassallia sp.]
MSYLLDTCVISELVAKQPNLKVVEWIDALDFNNVYLTVLTIGEIYKGIEKLSDSKRKTALHNWVNDDLMLRFSGKILLVDIEVVRQWGQLTGKLDLSGQRMSAIDSLIAAIAMNHRCSLVTRNEEDFKHVGLTIINPWKLL